MNDKHPDFMSKLIKNLKDIKIGNKKKCSKEMILELISESIENTIVNFDAYIEQEKAANLLTRVEAIRSRLDETKPCQMNNFVSPAIKTASNSKDNVRL